MDKSIRMLFNSIKKNDNFKEWKEKKEVWGLEHFKVGDEGREWKKL